MKAKLCLRINRRGAAKVSKDVPRRVDSDEVLLFLEVVLPDALFSKPRLEARMVVPDSVVAPTTVRAEVVDNVAAAIKTATGLDMVVRIVQPPSDDEVAR